MGRTNHSLFGMSAPGVSVDGSGLQKAPRDADMNFGGNQARAGANEFREGLVSSPIL